jgi:hypothetical protein
MFIIFWSDNVQIPSCTFFKCFIGKEWSNLTVYGTITQTSQSPNDNNKNGSNQMPNKKNLVK